MIVVLLVELSDGRLVELEFAPTVPEAGKFEEDPSGTPATERTFDQENRSSDLLRPETS